MSMVFAGFMGAAREDRLAREEREAEAELQKQKTEDELRIRGLTEYQKQAQKDAELGKDVDFLLSSYPQLSGMPRAAALKAVERLGLDGAMKLAEDGRLSGSWANSGGTGAAASYDGPVSPNAARAYEYFVEKGESEIMAAGVVANLMQESTPALDPTASGDGGNALGIAQWNGPRKRRFLKWSADNGRDPSDFETNLDFLHWEATESDEAPNWAKARNASTPEEAARILTEEFWRPSDPHTEKRMGYANQVYAVMLDDLQATEPGNTGTVSANNGGTASSASSTGTSTSTVGTPSATQTNYEGDLVILPKSEKKKEIDLGETIGMELSEINQFEAAYGADMTAEQRRRFDGIRTIAEAADKDPVWWQDPNNFDNKDSQDVQIALEIAQQQGDTNQIEALTPILELMKINEEAKEEDKIKPYNDTASLTKGNYIAMAAAAREDGNEERALVIEELGKSMVGASSKITQERAFLEHNGLTRTAWVTEDGNYMLQDGTVVPASEAQNVMSAGEMDDADTSLNRFADKTDPLMTQKAQFRTLARDAYSLDKLVQENESVLLATGAAASIAEKVKKNAEDLIGMFNSGKSLEDVTASFTLPEGLSGDASAHSRYKSELLKFAFNYASVGLGQSGQTLSNQDFQNALKIAEAGSSYGTFSTNLRGLVESSMNRVNDNISTTEELPQVRMFQSRFSEIADKILGPTFQRADGFLSDTAGGDEILEWISAEPGEARTRAERQGGSYDEAIVGGAGQEAPADVAAKVNNYRNSPTFTNAVQAYSSLSPEEKTKLVQFTAQRLGVPVGAIQPLFEGGQ